MPPIRGPRLVMPRLLAPVPRSPILLASVEDAAFEESNVWSSETSLGSEAWSPRFRATTPSSATSSSPDIASASIPLPLVELASQSTTTTRLRRRRGPPGHIPRPSNPWILWRAAMVPATHQKGESGMQASTRLSAVWRKMTDADKRPWFELAARLKAEHALKYPDYKFMPKKKGYSDADVTPPASVAGGSDTSETTSEVEPESTPQDASKESTVVPSLMATSATADSSPDGSTTNSVISSNHFEPVWAAIPVAQLPPVSDVSLLPASPYVHNSSVEAATLGHEHVYHMPHESLYAPGALGRGYEVNPYCNPSGFSAPWSQLASGWNLDLTAAPPVTPSIDAPIPDGFTHEPSENYAQER